MSPSVYLYNDTASGYELYLGECSTLDGLSLFSRELALDLTSFGATCYEKYGWATEEEIPKFSSVGDTISFLESEGDIGIVDFKADIKSVCTFGTHDDGECHFNFKTKQQCLSILKKVVPLQTRDLLINNLINNPGLYITCDTKNVIAKYSSFDEYLAKNV
jgi:hypothetical protein